MMEKKKNDKEAGGKTTTSGKVNSGCGVTVHVHTCAWLFAVLATKGHTHGLVCGESTSTAHPRW